MAGALAPDFELETLDGGRFRLSDWRGHPVLLNFWASWCPPCRREIPVLVRLQHQYREAGLVVAGVNIEEARRSAAAFRDEFSINFTLPMDFGGGVTRQYEVVGPPNSIFIRPDGVIDTIFIGQAPDDAFEEQVAALMTTLDEAVGEDLLPGPKALPLRFNPDGIPEALTIERPRPISWRSGSLVRRRGVCRTISHCRDSALQPAGMLGLSGGSRRRGAS